MKKPAPKTKPVNNFIPHDAYMTSTGVMRVWALVWGTDVYIDLDKENNVVGGTFVVGCNPSNELRDKAIPFLERLAKLPA